MRLPQLDERLQKAANLFPACGYGADIGADHGRLSCFLLAKERCERMCVSDLSAPSLEKAERLLHMHGLAERADFCVGDGITVLPQIADAIAVLGMGGKTIAHIIKDGRERLQGATLVLSAHTEVHLLRQALMDIDYTIESEDIAYAGGRFYVIVRAVPGKSCYNEKEILIGPKLLEGKSEHYLRYLEWRKEVLSCENSESGQMQYHLMEEEWQHANHHL